MVVFKVKLRMYSDLIATKLLSKLTSINKFNYSSDISHENWDNLIILDACRFDMYQRMYYNRSLPGILEKRTVNSSCTTEFVRNYYGEYYNDVVYINSNPYVDILAKSKFFKMVPIWKESWNEFYGTVTPESVFVHTLKYIKKYPRKRFIIHFMQPHWPFIHKDFRRIDLGISLDKFSRRKISEKFKMDFSVWRLVKMGLVSPDYAIGGYKKNLEMVTEYVIELLKFLNGTSVITSDHGEAFGERIHPKIPFKIYGHPCGVRINSLIEVPWHVVENTRASDIEKDKARIKYIIREKLLKDSKI